MERHPLEVSPDALRRVCDPNELGFNTTEEVHPVIGTVGQDRALSALEFGLEIPTDGYNMYVSGVLGTGRSTTVLAQVEQRAKTLPTPDDWCYVHNFTDSYHPNAISLPPGMVTQFARDMDDLVEQCKREIPRLFEADSYQQHRQQIMNQLERQREARYNQLEEVAQGLGLTVQLGPSGVVTVPILEGQPMTPEQYQALPDDVRRQLRDKGEQIQDDIVAFLHDVREAEQQVVQQVQQLDNESVLFAVGHLLQRLVSAYADYPEVVGYLQTVQDDIVEHHKLFRPAPESAPPTPAPIVTAPPWSRPEDPFARYRVAVLVTHQPGSGAPVIYEHNPTYYNVAGRIDYQPSFGTLSTDFRMIKAGALHKANGGFLVLQVRDVLLNPYAWEGLKRALECDEIAVENMGDSVQMVPTQTMRPDPIPLQLKVILIGNPQVYNVLYQGDEAFRKLFKVKADFDVEMPRDTEDVAIYAGFVRSRVDSDHLLHFDKTAVAKIVEYGSRLLEHQQKISTRFGEVADIVAEASFWAQKDSSKYVQAPHVDKAIQQREYRSSLNRDKIQSIINEGVIKISTQGQTPGQINGLSVLDLGDFVFGVPSRITANVSLGSKGIMNIEREIEMSGKIHSKGVLILSSYLGSQYAQDKPLSLSASLTFEQLYNEVDGDSASSTELYCLLSALAGVPLRQDIAVTGSVNQKGDIQAVGGVQYKIEGFFDICKAAGLTGDQGVMIPQTNLAHIMLREDVVEAARKGQFHIYAASSIAEGIELLTGLPMGERQPGGSFPAGSINQRVNQRLQEFADGLKSFEKAAEIK